MSFSIASVKSEPMVRKREKNIPINIRNGITATKPIVKSSYGIEDGASFTTSGCEADVE